MFISACNQRFSVRRSSRCGKMMACGVLTTATVSNNSGASSIIGSRGRFSPGPFLLPHSLKITAAKLTASICIARMDSCPAGFFVEKSTMESTIRFVTFKDLKQLYGVPYTRQGLLALEKQGLWPKRSNIGPGRFGWTSRQITERLEELARQSSQETKRARKAAAAPSG